MGTGPLGFPNGSIRALLALAIVFSVLGMAIKGMVVPDFLGVGFGLIIGLYFSKDSQVNEINEANKEKLQQMNDELQALKISNPIVVPTKET